MSKNSYIKWAHIGSGRQHTTSVINFQWNAQSSDFGHVRTYSSLQNVGTHAGPTNAWCLRQVAASQHPESGFSRKLPRRLSMHHDCDPLEKHKQQLSLNDRRVRWTYMASHAKFVDSDCGNDRRLLVAVHNFWLNRSVVHFGSSANFRCPVPMLHLILLIHHISMNCFSSDEDVA